MTPTEYHKQRPVAERSQALILRLAKDLAETSDQLVKEIDRDEKLMNGIQSRDKKIAELKRQVDELHARLDRLENARLLKIQREYWKVRKRLKKKFK